MATLTVQQNQPGPLSSTQTTLSYTGGLSQPVAVGSSSLSALVSSAAMSGSTWLVTLGVRPSADPSQIVTQLEQLPHEVFDALFGANPVEPFLTFRNLWRDAPALPERLAGVLLALAYQTDALRSPAGA